MVLYLKLYRDQRNKYHQKKTSVYHLQKSKVYYSIYKMLIRFYFIKYISYLSHGFLPINKFPFTTIRIYSFSSTGFTIHTNDKDDLIYSYFFTPKDGVKKIWIEPKRMAELTFIMDNTKTRCVWLLTIT